MAGDPTSSTHGDTPHALRVLLDAVDPVDRDAAQRAVERHGRLAKPPGSLGALEVLGARLAAIAGHCPPPVAQRPVVIVAAGDHGVHRQGVSDWPQAVTAAMVRTVGSGHATVNAFARTVGAEVTVLDVGTCTDPDVAVDGVVDARVARGTRDISLEPAMTRQECTRAVLEGARTAAAALTAGADLVALGEIGIGNTTASACLVSAFTGAEPAAITGRGANLDDRRLASKIEVVDRALRRHGDDTDALSTLASLGGLEHAALVGVILACSVARVPVVLDGVITGSAALAAAAIEPACSGYLVAGHVSAEPGAARTLSTLGLEPLLTLELRLGEGTGALLAVPLVQAAARALVEVALISEVT